MDDVATLVFRPYPDADTPYAELDDGRLVAPHPADAERVHPGVPWVCLLDGDVPTEDELDDDEEPPAVARLVAPAQAKPAAAVAPPRDLRELPWVGDDEVPEPVLGRMYPGGRRQKLEERKDRIELMYRRAWKRVKRLKQALQHVKRELAELDDPGST